MPTSGVLLRHQINVHGILLGPGACNFVVRCTVYPENILTTDIIERLWQLSANSHVPRDMQSERLRCCGKGMMCCHDNDDASSVCTYAASHIFASSHRLAGMASPYAKWGGNK